MWFLGKWRDWGWQKPTKPKKLQNHVALGIATHGPMEEVNSHRAPPRSENECHTMGQ